MFRLLRLKAHVTLDDPGPTLAQAQTAAAAGDESWERWVAEYLSGEALIVRLELSLEFVARERGLIRVANPGVFVEKHADAPRVEQQVAEVVSKDFTFLARDLNARGHRIDEVDLSEMYVHVELADDVLQALTDDRALARKSRGTPPEAEVRFSRTEDLSTDER